MKTIAFLVFGLVATCSSSFSRDWLGDLGEDLKKRVEEAPATLEAAVNDTKKEAERAGVPTFRVDVSQDDLKTVRDGSAVVTYLHPNPYTGAIAVGAETIRQWDEKYNGGRGFDVHGTVATGNFVATIPHRGNRGQHSQTGTTAESSSAQVQTQQREFAQAQMEARRQQAIRLGQLRARQMLYLQQVFAKNQAYFNEAMASGDVYSALIYKDNCAMVLKEYNALVSSPL